MNLGLLFLEFFKTGLFAIGGGLATLPFLTKFTVKYNWFTAKDLANIIAISESTPGPIGINMATYTGFTGRGILGGIISSIGIVLPSFIVTILIAKVLKKFSENRLVKNAFQGLRASVVGLIAAAVITIMQLSLFYQNTTGFFSSINYQALLLFIVITLFRFRFQKMHPIIVIAIGALLGIVLGGF